VNKGAFLTLKVRGNKTGNFGRGEIGGTHGRVLNSKRFLAIRVFPLPNQPGEEKAGEGPNPQMRVRGGRSVIQKKEGRSCTEKGGSSLNSIITKGDRNEEVSACRGGKRGHNQRRGGQTRGFLEGVLFRNRQPRAEERKEGTEFFRQRTGAVGGEGKSLAVKNIPYPSWKKKLKHSRREGKPHKLSDGLHQEGKGKVTNVFNSSLICRGGKKGGVIRRTTDGIPSMERIHCAFIKGFLLLQKA